ncbi:unnamed protein product [Medioppia subpectinata]|uniref:F-box domain-containing protein n=1 Tax=Medioppia subpectinata TaxID=1979941 RepID=A0A7R9KFB3_9ACAR|nr:unnamed protein product [Medioppia subpectinata]CAG2102269.1 unnamed protein product [Medioppia subpectinata]
MAQQLTQTMTSIETTDDGNTQKPQIYAKNSMDRYGDDLCEVLLSYLLPEDRFRCECVSKQFSRTVFKSVVDIKINDRLLKQIQDSSFGCEKHIPEVLGIFRNNCPHLRDICCNLSPKSSQLVAEFGPMVTRIGNIKLFTNYKAVTDCHQLLHLWLSPADKVFDPNSGIRDDILGDIDNWLAYVSSIEW